MPAGKAVSVFVCAVAARTFYGLGGTTARMKGVAPLAGGPAPACPDRRCMGRSAPTSGRFPEEKPLFCPIVPSAYYPVLLSRVLFRYWREFSGRSKTEAEKRKQVPAGQAALSLFSGCPDY